MNVKKNKTDNILNVFTNIVKWYHIRWGEVSWEGSQFWLT